MPDFYFTYGIAQGYPYKGGWTRVTAPSINLALNAFTAVHPKRENCLNCADYYSEREFKATDMYKSNSNRGYGEHEHITLDVECSDKEKDR